MICIICNFIEATTERCSTERNTHWSQELCFSRKTDVIPHNHYQELLRYLYFVNNDSINALNKLAKIRPFILMVLDDFVKIEPK